MTWCGKTYKTVLGPAIIAPCTSPQFIAVIGRLMTVQLNPYSQVTKAYRDTVELNPYSQVTDACRD